MKEKYKFDYGIKHSTFDDQQRYHSYNDEPSYIAKNEIAWYKHGTLHRTTGPAVIRKNGSVLYYINGKNITRQVIEWADNNGYNVVHADDLDENAMLLIGLVFSSKSS